MKKILSLIIVCCIAIMPAVFAGTNSTSGTDWDTPCEDFNEFLNENGQHSHQYEPYEDPKGVGLDLIIARTGEDVPCSLTLETRHDFENKETSIYGVVGVDISGIWQKKGE